MNFIPSSSSSSSSSSVVVAAVAVMINFTQSLTVLWTLKTITLMESLNLSSVLGKLRPRGVIKYQVIKYHVVAFLCLLFGFVASDGTSSLSA